MNKVDHSEEIKQIKSFSYFLTLLGLNLVSYIHFFSSREKSGDGFEIIVTDK